MLPYKNCIFLTFFLSREGYTQLQSKLSVVSLERLMADNAGCPGKGAFNFLVLLH